MSDKTVFFLGAGATKDVAPNAPLNKDLVKKAIDKFSSEESAKRIKKFIDDLFHNRENPLVDNQVWNLLDYMIQEERGTPEYNLEQLSKLKEDLLSLIIRLFDENLKEYRHQVCHNFISAIKKSRVGIISTNYDISIDNALLAHGIINYTSKIRTAVEIDPNQRYFGHGFKRAVKVLHPQVNTEGIELFKLHGSLNWLYCRKCNEFDLTAFQKGSVHASTGLYCCNDNCSNKYEPLLITPTMFKNYDNRIIKEIWSHAERKLISADNLVFIGYALKDEDYQIRCLLMKALLCKQKEYENVIVVEKIPEGQEDLRKLGEVEEKYRSLYGEAVQFKPIGFTEFVNSIDQFGLKVAKPTTTVWEPQS